jgi:2-dehydro-3-deoxyglucarate aldolase
LCRATDFGRNFNDYYRDHNENVLVVCMLEHIDAVNNVDAILAVPGIDATFIGPYDLSASMGRPGQISHPDVLEAQSALLAACRRHGVPAGIHVVPVGGAEVSRRIDEGFRFIACGIDTEFLLFAARHMLHSTGYRG